jgi:hypothetical protein
MDLKQAFIDTLDAGIKIGILTNLFSKFGVANAETEIVLNNSKKIEMKFNNVFSDSVLPAKIAKYISSGSLTGNSYTLSLINRNERSYLLHDVITSNSLSVTLLDAKGGASKTEISILEGAVEVNSKIDIKKTDDSTLTYSYPEPLTIGVKMYGF